MNFNWQWLLGLRINCKGGPLFGQESWLIITNTQEGKRTGVEGEKEPWLGRWRQVAMAAAKVEYT